MKVVLHSKANAKKKTKPAPLQRRFDHLMKQIDREQRQLEKLRNEFEPFVARVMELDCKMDIELLEPRTRLATRLIDFARRKSLSNWHREELDEWLKEVVTEIGAQDPQRALGLVQDYLKALSELPGNTDELEQVAAALAEGERALQEAENPASADQQNAQTSEAEDSVQGDLFGEDEDLFAETPDETEADEQPFADEFDDESFEPIQEPAQVASLDADWVKRLFRRAAQQLHPDRETDPKKQAAKQRRMTELLKARKDGDLLGLLKLCGAALGENELALAEEQMSHLCEQLDVQLNGVLAAQEALCFQSPLHSWVFSDLYSPQKKRREANFQEWKKDLSGEAKDMDRLVGEMRSIKVLKHFLDERNDARMREWMEDRLASMPEFY